MKSFKIVLVSMTAVFCLLLSGCDDDDDETVVEEPREVNLGFMAPRTKEVFRGAITGIEALLEDEEYEGESTVKDIASEFSHAFSSEEMHLGTLSKIYRIDLSLFNNDGEEVINLGRREIYVGDSRMNINYDSGYNCLAITTYHLPQTALRGDEGSMGSYECDDETTISVTWEINGTEEEPIFEVGYYHSTNGSVFKYENFYYYIDQNDHVENIEYKFIHIDPSYSLNLSTFE